MPSTFLSHPSIKTFEPKDINPNFDEAEDAENINDKNWKGLEDNDDNVTAQDSNDQAQQAKFFSFLFTQPHSTCANTQSLFECASNAKIDLRGETDI